MAPVGGGRTATGDTDGTEVTEKSPNKNRAGLLRYKTRPARPKWPFLAGFSHAWRTFYRFRQQEAAHGELCTAGEAETGLAITAHQAPLVRRAPGELEGTRGPGCGARGRRGLAFLKSRMQFDWVKIQQGLKTLRFQRCEFRV